MQRLHIDEGFRSLLPVLEPNERKLLARQLQAEGCRDPLVIWKSPEQKQPVILDGHNRYEICTDLDLPFQTVTAENCPTRESALIWIVLNQLGRRNLTPSQKSALAPELKRQFAVAARHRMLATQKNKTGRAAPQSFEEQETGEAADKAAELLGINRQYVYDAEKIERDAPEVLEHVKQGTLSIPQAKKVALLPLAERPAAIERIRNREEEEGGNIYRDGKLYPVKTNKEVKEWLFRHEQALGAIKALATMDVTPEDYLRLFQPEAADEIDDHLDAAMHWLTQFARCWRKRHEKAA